MDKTPAQWMVEPLRRYAQFTGRARRAEYWWFFLFGLVVGTVAAVIDRLLGLTTVGIGVLVSLGLIVPNLAVTVRRLHDTGRTDWWLLVPVLLAIPAAVGLIASVSAGATSGAMAALMGVCGTAAFVASLVLLVLYSTRGTAGPNRFGPDPLAP